MSEKARELLERAMESLDGGFLYRLELKEEIREYLNHFPDATKMVAVEEEKQEEEPVSDNDLILVERGLIGAACAAIAMRRYARESLICSVTKR
jgi:hypothetical protein